MGVKSFRTSTILCFLPIRLSSGASRYFTFYRAVLSLAASRYFISTESFYLSAFHDTLFLPSRVIFRHFTDTLFPAKSRYLSALHRYFISYRAALSFGVARYFISTESFYLLALHDTFQFCTNSFRLQDANTGLSGGTSEVQASEYHKRLCDVLTSKLCHRCPVRLQAAVRI